MKNYKKHVSEPWFTLIKNNIKTVEGRLNKGSFAKMKKNDIIIWFNKDTKKIRFVKTKIISIHKYKSFNNYIKTERLKNTLPLNTINTIKQGVDVYYQYYSKNDESKYGVFAIRLKLIK